ncbi:probable poly A polymerase [Rhodothermus phage RM378]|uniref:probable poly A polymerase n=1 Tax=Rhodothermus phage RM378 TaxID=148943 RepID=UPI000018F66E|nr:probable poly A polymerase [Rhodothermus phage RM378]
MPNFITNIRNSRFKEVLTEMYHCHHESEYHLEGNVLNHTLMVLQVVDKITADHREQTNLSLTALLHDSGKPYTRVVERGRVMFPGHEGVSTYIAPLLLCEVLRDSLITPKDAIQILYGVNYHMLHWKNPNLFMRLFTEMVNYTCLYNFLKKFNQCDLKGRVSTKPQKQEFPVIHYFENTPIGTVERHVYFMIGVPGSGKSTFLQKVGEGAIVSRDEIMMEYAAEIGITGDYNTVFREIHNNPMHKTKVNNRYMNAFRKAVEENEKVFVDATNMSYKSRRRFYNALRRDIAETVGYHYIVMLPDYFTCIERAENREGKSISREVVTDIARSLLLPCREHPNSIDTTIYMSDGHDEHVLRVAW